MTAPVARAVAATSASASATGSAPVAPSRPGPGDLVDRDASPRSGAWVMVTAPVIWGWIAQ